MGVDVEQQPAKCETTNIVTSGCLSIIKYLLPPASSLVQHIAAFLQGMPMHCAAHIFFQTDNNLQEIIDYGGKTPKFKVAFFSVKFKFDKKMHGVTVCMVCHKPCVAIPLCPIQNPFCIIT